MRRPGAIVAGDRNGRCGCAGVSKMAVGSVVSLLAMMVSWLTEVCGPVRCRLGRGAVAVRHPLDRSVDSPPKFRPRIGSTPPWAHWPGVACRRIIRSRTAATLPSLARCGGIPSAASGETWMTICFWPRMTSRGSSRAHSSCAHQILDARPIFHLARREAACERWRGTGDIDSLSWFSRALIEAGEL